MLDSSLYNLSNPALNDDIGQTYIGKILPYNPIGFGTVGNYNSPQLKGALQKDTAEITRKQKDKNNFKKILLGIGLIAAGIFTFKGGKKVFKWLGIQFAKIKTKLKK